MERDGNTLEIIRGHLSERPRYVVLKRLTSVQFLLVHSPYTVHKERFVRYSSNTRQASVRQFQARAELTSSII